MQLFQQLGDQVEAAWLAENYDESLFPSIAEAALKQADIPSKISAWDVLKWTLEQTELIIRTEQRRDPSRRALAIIVTDGRAGDRAAALHAIHSLSKAAAGVVVIDGEQGAVRLGLAAQLAQAAHAELLPLEHAA